MSFKLTCSTAGAAACVSPPKQPSENRKEPSFGIGQSADMEELSRCRAIGGIPDLCHERKSGPIFGVELTAQVASGRLFCLCEGAIGWLASKDDAV